MIDVETIRPASERDSVFVRFERLEVDVLNGMPGVRSARWAGPAASDEENNDLLLRQLLGMHDARNKVGTGVKPGTKERRGLEIATTRVVT